MHTVLASSQTYGQSITALPKIKHTFFSDHGYSYSSVLSFLSGWKIMGLGSLFLHIQLPLRNSPQWRGGNNRILVGIEPKQGYYLELQPRKRFFWTTVPVVPNYSEYLLTVLTQFERLVCDHTCIYWSSFYSLHYSSFCLFFRWKCLRECLVQMDSPCKKITACKPTNTVYQ